MKFTKGSIEEKRMLALLRHLKKHPIKERVLTPEEEKRVERWYELQEQYQDDEVQEKKYQKLLEVALRNPHGEAVVRPTHAAYLEWTENGDTQIEAIMLLYDTPDFNRMMKPVAYNICTEIVRVARYFGFDFESQYGQKFRPGYSCTAYLEDGSLELADYEHLII